MRPPLVGRGGTAWTHGHAPADSAMTGSHHNTIVLYHTIPYQYHSIPILSNGLHLVGRYSTAL